MKVEKAAKQLEALGNPTRLQVYRTLVRAGPDGLPVSRVQQKLKIPASTLSHHLHRLILTGLVTPGAAGDDPDLPGQLPGHGRAPGFLDRRVLRRCGLRSGAGQIGPLERIFHADNFQYSGNCE